MQIEFHSRRSRPNFPRRTFELRRWLRASMQTQVKNDRSASDVWILTDPEEFSCYFWPNRLDLPPFWRNKGSCLPILTEQARFASILTLHGKCWASSLVWVIYWSTCNRRVLWRLYLTAVYQSWVVLWTSSKFKRVKSALNSNDEVQI